MKATGIVRRIDDLGRVVIPIEIRRTMKIKERDPLEIFVDAGGVFFRKYNFTAPVQDMVGLLKTQIDETHDLEHRPELLRKVGEIEAILLQAQE